MNLLEEFYITIWDTNFNVLGIIDTIETLEIVKNLNKTGTFTLTVPLTNEYIKLLKIGNLITKDISNNLLEPYIITYKQISINNNGVETLEIQGKSLLYWLKSRVITKAYNTTDTIENILNALVNAECIDPIDSNRIIPNIILGINKNYTDKTTFITQSQYTELLSTLTSIAQLNYYGMQILMNPTEKKYIFDIYRGKDLTLDNTDGNNPLIFSSNLNNIMSETFTHSTVNLQTTAYVYGTLSDSKNTPELVIIGEDIKGLGRVEVGISGSDPTINGEQFNLTESNYNQIMTAVGEQTLANAEITKSFDGKLNMHAGLKYKLDFNVGDKISCINKSWDLNESLFITSVTEQYSVQGQQISLGFGIPLPTILDKINSIY